jgi:N-acyl-L-homoserine lactone synthetase
MKFYNITSKDVDTHTGLFASMHHLRWKMFYQNLGWRYGLNSVNGFEFDAYDDENAQHIVMVDNANKVQASCRLIPTTSPYMIADHCSDFVSDIEMPHTSKIWEISRFTCASNVPGFKGLSLPGHLAAAIIEFGISNNITQFIAWTTTDVKAMITRAGWDPSPVGEIRNTLEGKPSVICLYSSNKEALERMRSKHGIDAPLLYSTDNPYTPILINHTSNDFQTPLRDYQLMKLDVHTKETEDHFPFHYPVATIRTQHDCALI